MLAHLIEFVTLLLFVCFYLFIYFFFQHKKKYPLIFNHIAWNLTKHSPWERSLLALLHIFLGVKVLLFLGACDSTTTILKTNSCMWHMWSKWTSRSWKQLKEKELFALRSSNKKVGAEGAASHEITPKRTMLQRRWCSIPWWGRNLSKLFKTNPNQVLTLNTHDWLLIPLSNPNHWIN